MASGWMLILSLVGLSIVLNGMVMVQTEVKQSPVKNAMILCLGLLVFVFLYLVPYSFWRLTGSPVHWGGVLAVGGSLMGVVVYVFWLYSFRLKKAS
ncbi:MULTISPECIES: hypothetical protein [Pontibacillus]|uniref:Uncharacterized protein n=1 Tax=Pontibacillus chungwhensis TaxID=265426 RepID=A0ABY8V0E2_9BACI|nr:MULTISPECIES: hypothetical protein [Pontibacillus]MCD5324460.1 hypothetical protein [Pontibacillus sp. HN14]WIF99247.1 hypothetical protein QNI29_06185 [Pontibacillus chungwhensis]